MIRTLVLSLFIFSSFMATAQHCLTVEIHELRNCEGKVIIALLDKDEQDVKDIHAEISNNGSRAVFRDLPSGSYAIRFIHDENRNDELDTNLVGMPREGFGFSNDAVGRFGPKDFSKWLFRLDTDRLIRVPAHYIF